MKHISQNLALSLLITLIFSCISTIAVPQDIKAGTRRPLKMLICETYFPPVSSTAALNQITEMIKAGIDIDIYTKNKGPLNWAHADIEKYKLMDRVMYTLPTDLDAYDIIYCMFGYRGKDLVDALGNKKLKRAKIVTCFRGADITKNSFTKNYYKKLIEKGDYFLPVCDFFTRKLIAYGFPADRIIVSRSTIDCSLFTFKKRTLSPTEPINIVTVSRLVKKKGLEYSIKAIAELVKKYPRIQYTIVGFGDLQETLEKMVVRLNMENNIKFTGRLSQEQVAAVLDKSHIFVLPCVTAPNGDMEGIPNSAKEAMAMGLPVVSTFHAGIPELIQNGVSGFLVQEQDAAALASRIEYLIDHPEKWDAICRAARNTIEREYERNAVNKKLIDFFYAIAQQ